MSKLNKWMLGWLSLLMLVSFSAQAVVDIYEFDNDVTRERYLSFIEEMRCPKCQNQNLAGSDSPIASDLRRELYRLLMEDKSDKEIVDFMVARYGDYVLYRPQIKGNTALLWGLPAGLLLFGLVMVGFTVRQRRQQAQVSQGVEPRDRERLAKLLDAAAERDASKKG